MWSDVVFVRRQRSPSKRNDFIRDAFAKSANRYNVVLKFFKQEPLENYRSIVDAFSHIYKSVRINEPGKFGYYKQVRVEFDVRYAIDERPDGIV